MQSQKITEWDLSAHYPYTPIQQRSMETGTVHSPILPVIKAAVPGSVYKDLLAAGYIEDPYFDMNSMLCEWVSQRWWIYSANMKIPEKLKGRNIFLRFEGIDYKAHISFNKNILTKTPHEGMFLPFEYNITELVDFSGENNVQAVIESAPDEMGQIGYTSKTFTQKSRCNYKWDWCARMIGMGLYGEVKVENYGPCAVRYADITAFPEKNGEYKINFGLEIEAFDFAHTEAEYALYFKDELVCSKTARFDLNLGENIIYGDLKIKNPKLWNVNGHGGQNLYMLKIKISENGIISDEKEYKIGLREISYERCEGANSGSLPYIPVINGKKIYIKGVNISPFELMYGCVTREQLKKMLTMAKEHNINLIRVWGGGVIESFDFYDLCDELGIMVWQEFIQSSSGIDNIPSKRPEFLKLLEKVSKEALKVKRNHTCLTFWSGGNELTDEFGVPSTYEDENIKLLKNLCGELDKTRLMLPTSASGPREFIDVKTKGVSHDVHGHWKYLGATEHYKFYNESDSMLHSEFGCDGMTNYDKIEKFLSKPHRKVFSMAENHVWRHHGEWWDTYERDRAIFGEFDRDDLITFVKLSQVIQADGIRYILDSNRRRKFFNAGSIIWQYNEPYPNISCTALTDYWGDGKLALSYVGQSYRPRNASLKHDSLVYDKGEVFRGEVYAVNDLSAFFAEVKIKVSGEVGNVLFCKTEKKEIEENGTSKICDISFEIGDSPCYHVELTLNDGVFDFVSGYFFLVRGKDGFCDKEPVIKIFDKG